MKQINDIPQKPEQKVNHQVPGTSKAKVKLKDLKVVSEEIEKNPQVMALRNVKGLGLDKEGNVKKGFLKLPSGKVVSAKKFNAIIENL